MEYYLLGIFSGLIIATIVAILIPSRPINLSVPEYTYHSKNFSEAEIVDPVNALDSIDLS